MIVLLILAGVALASLFGENGILNNAETAKNQTNLANSKEQVSLAITSAMTYQDSLGVVTKSNLVTELNQLIGENNYEITGEKAGPWTVKVIPTGDETITNATGSTVEIKKVTEIIIAETTLKLKVGGSKGLTVTTVPSENIESLTYTSSDESVATVDSTGKIKSKEHLKSVLF